MAQNANQNQDLRNATISLILAHDPILDLEIADQEANMTSLLDEIIVGNYNMPARQDVQDWELLTDDLVSTRLGYFYIDSLCSTSTCISCDKH